MLESKVREIWPHYVNIDNFVLCDLHENGVLTEVEILAGRKGSWSVAHPFEIPASSIEGDIEFTRGTVEQKLFLDLPIEVTTNEKRTHLSIAFGKPADKLTWVELSEKCLAQIDEDRLLGFLVRLD